MQRLFMFDVGNEPDRLEGAPARALMVACGARTRSRVLGEVGPVTIAPRFAGGGGHPA